MAQRPKRLQKQRRWPSASRLLVAGVVVITGGLGVLDSLANATARAAPAVAHQLAPWNGKVTDRAAERAFAVAPSANDQSTAARLARRALQQEATASGALMVLGLQAQLRNERARAQAIFDYALALTRRELQARLWAIEDGALRGDLDNVLLNYDIALRTSLQAQEILFPILTSALDNSLVRQRLVPRLKSAEEWKDPFLHFAARTRSNPQDVALLVAELERARIPVALVDRLALVDALFETGSFEAAWSLYRTIDPAAKRDRSRGTEFTKGGEPHSVLDWTLGEGAFFQQGGSGALVGFSLAPATSGTLLRQAQLLPPGDYQLTGVSASVDQPAQTRPYWLITCADGRELGRVELQNSPSGEASFAGSFSVPANCPTQTVSLIARASDEIGGVTGQIIRAAVTPALEGAGG